MDLPTTMKAVVPSEPGPPDVLTLIEVPIPELTENQVLVKVKAIGLNRVDTYMRRGEWNGHSVPILGTECVGIVVTDRFPDLRPGTPVAAVAGGLGITSNGTYAEYTAVPKTNVVKLAESEEELLRMGLSWPQLATIPISYSAAWTCLFSILKLKPSQTLLIRGATSCFGRAALNLAVHAGVHVYASTRNLSRFSMLKDLGATDVVLEKANLSAHFTDPATKLDAVLDLVGFSTMPDSLCVLRRGGRHCLAGYLAGRDPMPDLRLLLETTGGVYFTFFCNYMFGKREWPMCEIPLVDIMMMVAQGQLNALPSRVFRFDEIHVAHELMERSDAGGKMVVVVNEG